jgi:hypothetical protein
VVVNSDADHGYFYWLHSAPYEHFHRITGIGEDAQWHDITGSKDVVEVLYLGSIFRSAADATNAYADAGTFPVSQYGAKVQRCPTGLPQRCTRLLIANSTPPVSSQWHDAFPVGACLIETMADLPTSLRAVAGVKAQTLATLAAVDRAAWGAAKKTCGSASGPFGFTLSRVAILDTHGHARSSFRVQQPFVLSIQWTVHHLSGRARATVVIHYQVPGGAAWKTVATGREQVVAVNRNNFLQKQVALNAANRYRIVVTITIRSLARQAVTTVTITQ